MARNEGFLAEYEKEMTEKGIEVHTQIADDENLAGALAKVKEVYGVPDVLVYNEGVTVPDEKGKVTSEMLRGRYQVDVVGAYAAVRECKHSVLLLIYF